MTTVLACWVQVLLLVSFSTCFNSVTGNVTIAQIDDRVPYHEDCRYTKCTYQSKCMLGWIEMYKEGCESGESKKFCCKEGHTPLCYNTPCDTSTFGGPDCHSGYSEWDKDKESCGFLQAKTLCCMKRFKPQCFNTSCHSISKKRCPRSYFSVKRMAGWGGGCPLSKEKHTCCTNNPSNPLYFGSATTTTAKGKLVMGWVCFLFFLLVVYAKQD